MNGQLEDSRAEVFVERNGKRPDRHQPAGGHPAREGQSVLAQLRQLGNRVGGQLPAGPFAALRDRFVVGVAVEDGGVVVHRVRHRCGGGFRCVEVQADGQDGTPCVAHERADIPGAEPGRVPLVGPNTGDQLDKRLGRRRKRFKRGHVFHRGTGHWHNVPMTAIRPPYVDVQGTSIRLEPLTPERLPELFAAIGHPIVFGGGFGGGPSGYRDTVDGFTEWALGYFAWERSNVYGIVISGGPHDGQLVGTTTLGDFELEFEHSHIGWTALDPRVWGTQVNAEAKLLLLGTAFDAGLGRIKIQADVLNERSRAAIAGIGATFEGIVRRDRPRADGTWRDSAVFSIIIDDWPRVRALLQARVYKYDGRPVLFRTPRTS